jgi:hypothetical protein
MSRDCWAASPVMGMGWPWLDISNQDFMASVGPAPSFRYRTKEIG